MMKKGEKIGSGGSKDVFIDAKDPKKIISEFQEQLEEKQIKSAYYLNKIAHLLFPDNIPEVHAVGSNPSSFMRVDRVEVDSRHRKAMELRMKDQSYLEEAYLKGDWKTARRLSDKEEKQIYDEIKKKETDPRVRKFIDAAYAAGFPIDIGGQNFSIGSDGRVAYLDLNPIQVGSSLPLDKQKLWEAIQNLSPSEKEEAIRYFKRLELLMEELS